MCPLCRRSIMKGRFVNTNLVMSRTVFTCLCPTLYGRTESGSWLSAISFVPNPSFSMYIGCKLSVCSTPLDCSVLPSKIFCRFVSSHVIETDLLLTFYVNLFTKKLRKRLFSIWKLWLISKHNFCTRPYRKPRWSYTSVNTVIPYFFFQKYVS